MATPVLVTQAQVERRFGAKTVRDFADDTGDATTVASIVAECCEEASGRALEAMRPGWSTEQIAAMCTGSEPDKAVIGSVCDIAMGILTRRRVAFIGEESARLYGGIEKDAEKRLVERAKGNLRPSGETAPGAGANATRIGVSTNRDEKALLFQGNRSNPRGPGGF